MNTYTNKPMGYTIVIITDDKRQKRRGKGRGRGDNKHMITLKPGGRFSTEYGYIEHDLMASLPSGSVVETIGKPHPYKVYRVSYRDYVMHIKRQAQIIYPKDTAAILMWGDIAPHQNILESGIGQGALSIALLRALGGTGKLTSYELRQDFADMSKKFIAEFLGEEPQNHDIEVRNVYEGVDGVYDRVVLDLPEPWHVVQHLKESLLTGGILVSYIPTVLQVKTMVETLKESGYFDEIETFELILRPWKVDGLSVRPEMWTYNHSAFIISARKCIPSAMPDTPDIIEEN